MEDIHPKSQSGRFKYTMKYRILLLRVVDFARHVCCIPLLRDVNDSIFQHFQDFDDLRRRLAQTNIIFGTFFDGQDLRTC